MSLLDKKIINIAIISLLFLLSFSYFLYGYEYFNLMSYHYDEAISTYGASRILEGDVPYRDFWTLYFPGQFYILAAVFKIFGINIKVAKLFSVGVLALTVCSVYCLIKKLCLRVFAVLSVFFTLAWLRYFMVFNRPGQLAVLFFILSCFSLMAFIEHKTNKWLIITGSIVSVAALFRQDFGFYIFIAMSLVVILKKMNECVKGRQGVKLNPIFKNELFLLSGSAAVILPLAGYLIYNSAFKEFIYDAVIFPATIYPKVRDLPFPVLKINTLIFYIPLFIFLLTSIRLLFYNWRDEIKGNMPWLMLFLLFSGLGLFNYTRVRTHMGSLLPVMIPAIILFILLFNELFLKFRGNRAVANVLVVVFLMSFTLSFYSIKKDYGRLAYLFSNKDRSGLDVPRAAGFYDDSELAQSQISAIKFIRDNTAPDEKIFVGNLRHDKVVNSDVMFYFLSERDSATKYYELHPGVTNRKEIQKEIIAELNKNKVSYVVLWSVHDELIEPNESGKSSGVEDLDKFIRSNYQIVKEFDYYFVLKRKNST